jgi:hypothetical protein
MFFMKRKAADNREAIAGDQPTTGICTTCNQRVLWSAGAMCYRNLTQHLYDDTVYRNNVTYSNKIKSDAIT